MNPQQDAWMNESKPEKKFSKKPSSEKMPHHGGNEDEHAAAEAEHGKILHSHITSNHDADEHHVTLEHEDGHKRESDHSSIPEATQHINDAHAAGDNEQAEGEEIGGHVTSPISGGFGSGRY